MTSISAQYNKEIDTLRTQLNEARQTIGSYERTKLMQQENLKKAFMKGVCAMNMEAMTILNPSEGNDMERKLESLAEGVFSESTPIRQLAFNNGSEYQAYDSNVKADEIFKKFGMQMSDTNSERDVEAEKSSIHDTPQDRHRTEENHYSAEKEIKVERNAFTELETATMTRQQAYSSAVKIHKPGDDIVINNTKIESKDNAWKPAPQMTTEPTIINNAQNPASFGYRSNSMSFNPATSVPKHTLGMQNISGAEMFSNFSKPNKDLIESLGHNTSAEISYQPLGMSKTSQVVPEFRGVVKENMPSNVLDSMPSSNLPTVMNKSTTSVGGKTIRVNSRQASAVKEAPTKENSRSSVKGSAQKRPSATRWR